MAIPQILLASSIGRLTQCSWYHGIELSLLSRCYKKPFKPQSYPAPRLAVVHSQIVSYRRSRPSDRQQCRDMIFPTWANTDGTMHRNVRPHGQGQRHPAGEGRHMGTRSPTDDIHHTHFYTFSTTWLISTCMTVDAVQTVE